MVNRLWSIYLDALSWEGPADQPAPEINGYLVGDEVARFAAKSGVARTKFTFDPEADGVAVLSESESDLRQLVAGLIEAGLFLDADIGKDIQEVEAHGSLQAFESDSAIESDAPLMDGPYRQPGTDVMYAYISHFEREAWHGMSDAELMADVATVLVEAGLQDRLTARQVEPGVITLNGPSLEDFRRFAARVGMDIDDESL